jgi:hypothetical protein
VCQLPPVDGRTERVGDVVAHPLDPGGWDRIEALKASIPKGALDGLVANASTLSRASVPAMVAEWNAAGRSDPREELGSKSGVPDVRPNAHRA